MKDVVSQSMNLTLFPDTQWKEKVLSKLEIMLDDARNVGTAEKFDELDNFLKFDESYTLTITLERKP